MVAVIVSYLSSSLSFPWLVARMHGVDLRTVGSRKLGGSNLGKTLGLRAGIAGGVLDGAKGFAAVLVARAIGLPLETQLACGIAAIVGHVRPIFLGLRRGGKGVATAAGVFFALAPIPMAVTFVVFVVVVLATGYVSLGSMISAVVLPAFLLATLGLRSPLFVVSAIIALFVFWTHRSNIGRLRRGEEHRFGRRGSA
jgi:glycerol-3-phosphate acyltransferase PlsY